jgi:hypothetical protein
MKLINALNVSDAACLDGYEVESWFSLQDETLYITLADETRYTCADDLQIILSEEGSAIVTLNDEDTGLPIEVAMTFCIHRRMTPDDVVAHYGGQA